MEGTCGFVTKLSITLLTIVLITRPGLRACSETERAALLEIKSFFQSAIDIKYVDQVMGSWVVNDDDGGGGGLVSDCCDWEGIKCNPTTGRVMELSLYDSMHLSYASMYHTFTSDTHRVILMNVSLFHPFEELQSLDLSFIGLGGFVHENKGSNFDSSGSLKQLKILNLAWNEFNNSVLPYLNTLTSLTTLILDWNEIEADSVTKQGLSNLKNLQELDLNCNSQMTSGSLTRLGLANLTNLKTLNLPSCGITSLRGLANLTNLTNLTNLKTLNLADNGITSLRELTNLRNLEELDLSFNENITSGSLTGLGLANLTNLEVLDLSYNLMNGSLESLGTLCQLKNLIELDLSYSGLDDRVSKYLNNFIHLKFLDMSGNQLSGNLLDSTSWIVNLTSLEFLDVSDNNFQGLFSFCSLANHSKLQVLLMSNNRLSLPKSEENCVPTFQLKALIMSYTNINVIPSFLLHQNHLKFIDLSHNKLVGNFPTWLLHNNTKLEVLRLRDNSLSGTLEMPPKAAEHDYLLLHLDISINNFTGELPKNLGIILHQLMYVDISKNSFHGNLPNSIGELKELEILDLSKNNFSSELPHSVVTGCFSLRLLDISNNNLYGEIVSKDFNLTQVLFLYLENNHFGGNFLDGLLSCAFLVALDVSNNMLSGQIPRWFGNFSSQLEFLSLSKNRFEGDIPPRLFSLPRISILDISENSLSGQSLSSSFNLSSSMEHLYMQKNALSGLIPSSLFRSSTLMTLDLRDNRFSDKIPNQHISEHSGLRVILLRGNNLQGDIPHELCQLQNLGMMDLSSNKLTGSIPSCLGNMSFWREEGDELYGNYLENNSDFGIGLMGSYYSTTVSDYFANYEDSHTAIHQHVQVEFSTKNRYELYNGSNLNYMSGLDLSCNELTGEIPSEMGQLQKIHALNLSHNYLSGAIPKTFSDMKMIESLDLSYNKLSGRIPLQLDELNFLSNFNVSFNNLSGPIPDKGQFDGTFDDSSYVGNEDLCGSLIKRKCESNMLIPPESSDEEEEEEEEEEGAIYLVELYWSFGASYVTILLCWVAVLWINSNWRRRWFYFIDRCIDTCYYWIYKYVIYRRR